MIVEVVGRFLLIQSMLRVVAATTTCDRKESDWDQLLPDLACCDIGATDDTCQFTSACNSHGVCCADPKRHPGYKAEFGMALTG